MRRTMSRLMWVCAGVIAALVLLEGAFRLLPVSMGLYRTSDYARWPLQNTEPRLRYSYSISWSMLNAHRGVSNNYGHVAPFDYHKASRPVIVVGDSYIESLMNDYGDTLQGQLGRKLAAPESVYGLGVSGLSASDYVALSRLARDEFAPTAAVFLITDGDLSESLGRRVGNYYVVPDGTRLRLDYSPARGDSLATQIRRRIGDLALYRYIQVNLQFSLDPLLKALSADARASTVREMPRSDVGAQRRVADWFLEELPASLGVAPRCIALLVDTDRYAIYNPALASPRKDDPQAWQYFMARARQLGFQVSDLDEVFRRKFAEDHTRFDYWPVDRHWNRVGHGVGADEAYRLLFQQPGATACSPERRGWN